MDKKDYITPIADIAELSVDIVLLSDEEGWGDLIPFNSAKSKANDTSTESKW